MAKAIPNYTIIELLSSINGNYYLYRVISEWNIDGDRAQYLP